jgi:uncharacterized delta-60 repeat protein
MAALKLGLVFALLAALLVPALSHAAKPGQLDRSFGDGGRVKAAYGVATSVAIDSQERIVLGGTYFDLVRFWPNGTPDESFGSDGLATTPFPHLDGSDRAYARSMAVDSQSRIVLAGALCHYDDIGLTGCQVALARHEPDGTPDGSFGAGGTITLKCQRRCGAESVATDSQDRIVIASTNGGPASLTRYDTGGSLDHSFGDGGKVKTDLRVSPGRSIAIDSQDRIVVAGSVGGVFSIARYESNGTLDPSFGVGGVATAEFRREADANSVAIRPHGRIVAAGVVAARQRPSNFAIGRFRPNGSLDRSFSGNGELTTSFGPRPYDRASAMSVAFDSRRRIIAVGNACRNSYRCNFALARYERDGSLDRSFGTRGKVTTTGHYAIAHAAAIDSRDRIYVAGGHAHFLVARYIGYRQGR